MCAFMSLTTNQIRRSNMFLFTFLVIRIIVVYVQNKKKMFSVFETLVLLPQDEAL